jgi:hypothetical protein
MVQFLFCFVTLDYNVGENISHTTCKLLQVLEHCTYSLAFDNFAKRCVTLCIIITFTSVYNILYLRSFQCLSVHIGLNGYGKNVIISSFYRCVCSFVGNLLRKTTSVQAHESTRDLADFCLYVVHCAERTVCTVHNTHTHTHTHNWSEKYAAMTLNMSIVTCTCEPLM